MDWYTKGVLTVIAVLLAVIAFRPYVSPEAVVQAQWSFAGVQFAFDGCGDCYSWFDTRTGEIWSYQGTHSPSKSRLTKLGSPVVREK